MNKRSTFISLILLSIILLTACSSAAPAATQAPAASGSDSSSSQSADPGITGKINLNTASGDEFMSAIPGLVNRMVREFMEYRPYISIQQFRQEIGKYVDDAQVAEYEKYVYVPIAINDSDAATLQQIPGLSTGDAESLIAARPFASVDDFLTRLSEYVSTDELELANAYLGGS